MPLPSFHKSLPERETSTPFIRSPMVQRSGINLFLHGAMPDFHAFVQKKRILYGIDRVPASFLRAISRTVLVQKGISRISSGIIAMPWTIDPPPEKKANKKAIAIAANIKKSLLRPNRDDVLNTYNKIVTAIVTDIITLGFAAIERQPGTTEDQAFWLWVADAANIYANDHWSANKEGAIPKFFDTGGRNGVSASSSWVPIFSKNLFIIQKNADSYERIPPSAVESIYYFLMSWLGITQFQDRTTSNAVREYLLSIINIDNQELKAFREYWETEVINQGKIPILSGEVQVVKLGAKTDEELYLKYTEYLLKTIALGLGLTPRDFNITEHDNRATAGAAADSTFADAILPMANVIAEHINSEVIDYYFPGYTFNFSDTEPRSQSDEANTAKVLFKDGNIITRNEARKRVGEEPLDPAVGNLFGDGSTLDGKPPAQPGMEGMAGGMPGMTDQSGQPGQETPLTFKDSFAKSFFGESDAEDEETDTEESSEENTEEPEDSEEDNPKKKKKKEKTENTFLKASAAKTFNKKSGNKYVQLKLFD